MPTSGPTRGPVVPSGAIRARPPALRQATQLEGRPPCRAGPHPRPGGYRGASRHCGASRHYRAQGACRRLGGRHDHRQGSQGGTGQPGGPGRQVHTPRPRPPQDGRRRGGQSPGPADALRPDRRPHHHIITVDNGKAFAYHGWNDQGRALIVHTDLLEMDEITNYDLACWNRQKGSSINMGNLNSVQDIWSGFMSHVLGRDTLTLGISRLIQSPSE